MKMSWLFGARVNFFVWIQENFCCAAKRIFFCIFWIRCIKLFLFAQKQEIFLVAKCFARTNVLCCIKIRQYLDQLIHVDIIMFAKASVRTTRNRFCLPETIQGHTHGIVKKKICMHLVDGTISYRYYFIFKRS